jgi:hypothetical protein
MVGEKKRQLLSGLIPFRGREREREKRKKRRNNNLIAL